MTRSRALSGRVLAAANVVWSGKSPSTGTVPMSDCLHCDINDLVEKQLERDDADLGDLAARLTESLADLILLAPPPDQSNLMADVLANLVHAYSDKTRPIDSTPSQSFGPGREVVGYFQEGGLGWEDRINEALRKAAGK